MMRLLGDIRVAVKHIQKRLVREQWQETWLGVLGWLQWDRGAHLFFFFLEFIFLLFIYLFIL